MKKELSNKIEIDIGKTHFVFNANDLKYKTAFDYAKVHQKRNPNVTGLFYLDLSEENAQKYLQQEERQTKA